MTTTSLPQEPDKMSQIAEMKGDLMEVIEMLTENIDARMLTFSFELYSTLIIQQNERLNRVYPERAKQNLWRHGMIGSTAKPDTAEDLDDFPGEDAVRKFVDRMQKNIHGIISSVSERIKALETKYPDANDYEWFTRVTGNLRSTNKQDFPGDDALEPFLRSLEARVVPRATGPLHDATTTDSTEATA